MLKYSNRGLVAMATKCLHDFHREFIGKYDSFPCNFTMNFIIHSDVMILYVYYMLVGVDSMSYSEKQSGSYHVAMETLIFSKSGENQ